MTSKRVGSRERLLPKSLIAGGLGLIFCLGAMPSRAQQDQPGDVQQRTVQQQQNDQTQAPPDQAPPQSQAAQPNQAAPPNQATPPQSLTLPAGTVIRVRVDEWLSSEQNLPGDMFSAVLDQPIVVDGWVVARRGQAETGQVAVAKKAGHGGGTSQLGVQLSELTLVDGQKLALQTQMVQTSAGGPTPGQTAAVVGTTAGVGAAVGAVVDGGPGAAIGAAAGIAAGAIGVQATRGRPTVIPPESVLSFRLQAPATISTERSQLAFQPVTQDDYNSRSANGRPQRFAAPGGAPGPGYPPPPAYYGYPYPYPYPYAYYPVPFAFGFYGGFGYGPRFGGFRGGFR